MQNANGLISKTIFSDAIDVAASWLAMFGGIVLLGILVMVSVSISLRALGMMPIQGDFELLQVGLAIAPAPDRHAMILNMINTRRPAIASS